MQIKEGVALTTFSTFSLDDIIGWHIKYLIETKNGGKNQISFFN